MQTEYLKADPYRTDDPALEQAVQLLEASEIVAFPTETVYGVGARVFDEAAVKKIFIAKNRPAEQALLVHISKIEQLADIVAEITPEARLLMEKFWPGPLSIVLPAHPRLPRVVTGGKNTVGLRMPSHPMAKALIDKTGPLAATSANQSGRPSPLTAEHVKADLGGSIAAVLDGGPTGQGMESTIIDMSKTHFMIIRRGGISVKALETVLARSLDLQPDDNTVRYHTKFASIVARDQEEVERYLQDHKNQALGIVYYDEACKRMKDEYLNIRAEYILVLHENDTQFFSILRDAENKELEVLLWSPLPPDLSDSLRDRIHKATVDDYQGA